MRMAVVPIPMVLSWVVVAIYVVLAADVAAVDTNVAFALRLRSPYASVVLWE